MLTILLALTLGNLDYDVRAATFRLLASEPYTAIIVATAAEYHPDAEVRKSARFLLPRRWLAFINVRSTNATRRQNAFRDLGLLSVQEYNLWEDQDCSSWVPMETLYMRLEWYPKLWRLAYVRYL